jgi:dihydroflavonol-4-reductase
MKVFVTGATGFVGTRFAQRLAQTDHELYCLVRKTSDVRRLKEIGANLVYGDVTDRASVLEGMKGCDWVVHLAGIYSFWEPDDSVFTDVNVTGTRNVMEAAVENRVSKVVHTSTIAVYGSPDNGSGSGEDGYRADLDSRYSRTKYEADMICWGLYARRGLPLVVVYPGSVLGAGDRKPSGEYIDNVARGRMHMRILSDFYNTYVYVGDVAEAILKALEKPDNIGEKYPVGNGEVTWRELNEMICELTGATKPFIPIPNPLLTYMSVWTTWFAEMMQITPAPILDLYSKWLGWNADWLGRLPGRLFAYFSDMDRLFADWLESRRPLYGLSIGTVGTVMRDLLFDGGKVERELGLTYPPIREALEEEVAQYAV